MLTVNPPPVLRLDSESGLECDKWQGGMYIVNTFQSFSVQMFGRSSLEKKAGLRQVLGM